MNAPQTFPSRVEKANLPRKYIDTPYFQSRQNTFVASAEARPFHAEGMEQARRRVADRIRINSKNLANYGVGGYRNQIPKPQPQGSFQRPFSTSGNIGYGTHQMRGAGGAFRTPAGASYGQQRLKARGQQLEQLNLLQQEGIEGLTTIRPSAEPSVPLTKGETAQITAELLMSDLVDNFSNGDYEEIKEDDLRKLINSLRTEGLNVDLGTLNRFQSQIGEIIDGIRLLIGTPEGRAELEEGKLTLAKRRNLGRISILVEGLVASYDLNEKDRKAYIRSLSQKLSKSGGIDTSLKPPPVPKGARRQVIPAPTGRAEEILEKADMPVAPAIAPAVAPAVAPAPVGASKFERFKDAIDNARFKNELKDIADTLYVALFEKDTQVPTLKYLKEGSIPTLKDKLKREVDRLEKLEAGEEVAQRPPEQLEKKRGRKKKDTEVVQATTTLATAEPALGEIIQETAEAVIEAFNESGRAFGTKDIVDTTIQEVSSNLGRELTADEIAMVRDIVRDSN